jgi:hypothetical protein
MEHSSDGTSKINAFVYMAVENNDFKMINTKKVESPRNLVLKYNEEREVKTV